MFFIFVLVIAAILLIGGTVAVIWLDTQRMLVMLRRSPRALARYRSHLPNVLANLAQAGLPAWPVRVSGVSIYHFRRRMRRLIPHPSAREDIDTHVGLWLHIVEHRDLLNLGLFGAISRTARRVCELGGDAERLRYGGLLLQAEEQRQRAYAHLHRHLGSRCMSHANRVLEEMRCWEIIFEEHGYQLHPGFTQLRELEEALAPTVQAH